MKVITPAQFKHLTTRELAIQWLLPAIAAIGLIFVQSAKYNQLFDDVNSILIIALCYRGFRYGKIASATTRTFVEFEKSSPVIRYFKTKNGELMYANPLYYSQIVPLKLEDVRHTDFAKDLAKYEALVFKTKTVQAFSCHLSLPQGVRWMTILLFPVSDSEGSVYAVGGMMRDATQLKDLQENFREILEAIDSSARVTVVDENGILLEANDNFLKVSEYAREELVGKDFRLMRPETKTKNFYDAMMAELKEKGRWVGVLDHRAKSGKLYDVQCMITRLSPTATLPALYVAIRFETTDQKKLEKQLIEAQTIAKIGSWKFYTDTTLAPEWTHEMYAICEIDVETPREQLFPQFYKRISAEKIALTEKLLFQAQDTTNDFTIDYELDFDDGARKKFLRCFGRANRDESGVTVSFSGTLQDISLSKEQDKQLEIERMKSLQPAKLASLGEMSAGIAHEINNPLGVIAGNIRLLTRFKDDPERLKKKLEDMKKAAYRIERIVKSLKKFSRNSEASAMKDTSLSEIVSDAMMITEAKQKRFEVPLMMEIDENLVIHGDNVEVEQVLVNLVNNAIEAVAGTELPWVKITASRNGESVVIRVIDSGLGIPIEIEKKLFEPFFTTKPVGQGPGLGLSISKAILQNRGAKFFLNRDFNNTCFEIQFPTVDAKGETGHVA